MRDISTTYQLAYETYDGNVQARDVARDPEASEETLMATSTVKLKDRYSGGHVWLTVRDGRVIGAMGSDPKRYIGMSIDRARHVARYGGTGAQVTERRAHATVATGIGIGDIVQRSDIDNKNRYVVVNVAGPWIYTHRISGRGGPGVITFPSAHMLRKVA